MTIAPIETRYAGHRFRSRTEARWAVFFDVVGIRYQYEANGFVVRSGAYLPDFWLPELRLFFEVKGEDPTDEERQKCRDLTEASECDMILAPGPPEPVFKLLWFDRDGEHDGRFVIQRDFYIDFGFWLIGDSEEAFRIGPTMRLGDVPHGPVSIGALATAYEEAASARFETRQDQQRRPMLIEPDPIRRGEEPVNEDWFDSDAEAAA